MLHTKFRGNQPAGSREKDFCRVFTINGHGGHLGHGRFKKKMMFFLKTDLQQTQNGFQMWFLCQNMCLVNVEIAGKFQVNICIRYKFIAL